MSSRSIQSRSTQSRSTKKATKSATQPRSSTNSSDTPSYIAFWKPSGPYGLYSQWYASKFKFDSKIREALPDEITSLSLFTDHPELIESFEGTYNCAEQFMMLGKALLFEDEYIANQIRNEHSPARQKKLGRTVSGFDDDIWMQYATDIVTLGSYLKFTQYWQRKQSILDSGDAVLIEGSPMDKIWGVGLWYDNSKIADPKNWKGQNLLGKCLMRAREIIRNEEK